LLQNRFTRGASAAIHVVFITLVLWGVWRALQPQSWAWGEPAEKISRVIAMVGIAFAILMAIGLVLWLRKGRIELLLIPDNILLVVFGFAAWQSLDVRFVVSFLALAAALVPVLMDPRRQQRATPPVYWPGYGSGAPPYSPADSAASERPKPPPTS